MKRMSKSCRPATNVPEVNALLQALTVRWDVKPDPWPILSEGWRAKAESKELCLRDTI